MEYINYVVEIIYTLYIDRISNCLPEFSLLFAMDTSIYKSARRARTSCRVDNVGKIEYAARI